jgi:hypothetical protein
VRDVPRAGNVTCVIRVITCRGLHPTLSRRIHARPGTDKNDPEYYRIQVFNAMRITSSGEFLHGAPWSVGYQGRANVSHGCIGMSSANAEWLFDQSSLGDVVEITGTNLPQDLGNGVTVWTEAWSQWLANSATGAHWTTADPGLGDSATGELPTGSASPSESPSASAPAA